MAKKVTNIQVKDTLIRTMQQNGIDYVCITDIARQKNGSDPNGVIANWMRNRNTIEFLGIWEQLFNPSFNPLEFEGFRKEAGLNAFTMSPSRWIEATNAKGLVATAGRYGGTYARTDIAFEFASWISVEFKLYLVKEFQRLKEEEQKQIGWSVKRELSKLNGEIYTLPVFTAKYMPRNKRSVSGVCQGPKYFTKGGVSLYKLKESFLGGKKK